jgi:tetratricopeptide (TPR) repeat protein
MSLTRFQRLTASAIALALCATIVVSAQRAGVLPGAARPKVVPGVAAPAARPAPGGQGQIAALQARLRDRPDDVKALGQLGQLYVQGARETGDPAYYPRAEEAFRRALERDPNDVTALAGLSALALARHQFGAALDWGERARALAPPTAAIYGVIGDAQIELGRYDDAVATFQQMVDLRPDLNSYTRVSYARELHGDVPGAIEAMRRAAAAGAPGQEGTAWARVQLGHLHFNSGAPDAARAEYERALRELPDYPHALAGLGRVAAAGGDYAAASELYRRATARVPIAEYVIALGDVYTVAGRPDAAAEQYALAGVQDRLLAANGANTDLEFALFAADRPEAGLDPRQVVERASAAVAERPSIYAHDVLAWALYRAGDYEAAREQIDTALRLGTRDASFHFHAGAIARARGDNDAARAHFEEALRINPHFSLLHAPAARAALDELAAD